MSQDLEARVFAFVREQTGFEGQISRATDIFADLGVDGIDAMELLERFAKQFSVDMSGLQYDQHFGPELPFNPFALLRPSWWRWHRERIPVTIALLIEAAKGMKWPARYAAT